MNNLALQQRDVEYTAVNYFMAFFYSSILAIENGKGWLL